MAWQMAGFELEHGSTRHAPEPWGNNLETAQKRAARVADRFGVNLIAEETLNKFKAERESRSVYVIDVRTPDEFRAGHRPDSSHAWGVQLVQSIDKYVATRNSRIVLVDNYRVRALMTAAWLVQIGWGEVFMLEDPFRGTGLETGSVPETAAEGVALPYLDGAELSLLLEAGDVTILDFSDSISYRNGHIPGAWFMIRSRIADDLSHIPDAGNLVATGSDDSVIAMAARDLAKYTGKPVSILRGGNLAWRQAGLPNERGLEKAASRTDDIFRMPFLWGHFENKSEFEQAAHAYFAWELQLPEQLAKSGEIQFFRPR
jgi:rhodanese-related sulfurtransferase